MFKNIVKIYELMFKGSFCTHDWKIVNTEKWYETYGSLFGNDTIKTNQETKIYEVCQKCKETRTRFIKGYWKKEDLI